MRRKILSLGIVLMGVVSLAQADTVANYMTIVENIPKMAMKADEQSQAWVRSARNIITSTDETMLQTIIAMNASAAKNGKPIFCFSPGKPFDATTVDQIIQKTYAELLKMQGTSVGTMTVSDVLMVGMASQYSCAASPLASTLPMNSGPSATTSEKQTRQPMTSSQTMPEFDNSENDDPYATPTQVSVSAEDPPEL